LAGYAPAQSPAAGSPAPASHRILVKLQPSLADEIEAELPVQAMELRRGQATGARARSFMGQHNPQRLAPLYPGMVRLKKQNGWNDARIASQVGQRFAARTARLRQPAVTPQISRTYILEFNGASAAEMQSALQRLQADPNVEFAEPEHIFHTSQITNDPFLSSTGTWGQSYPDLWGILKINAPLAWNTSTGQGIIVAVVDTGIDYNHPDLAANVWINTGEIAGNGTDDDGNGFIDDVRGWDFIGPNFFNPTPGNDPIDHFGHGTHVAGTIAAIGNNGIGVVGVAWQARVMAVKGLDDNGFGSDSTLAPAILYAANNGADIISASWGEQGTSQTIEDAIKFAYGLGVVFVAAAGNSSSDAVNFFPANSPEAITVAASDAFDQFASFSNFGSKIDVTAPGVDVLSLRAAGTNLGALVGADYMRLSGTSMATPHVSGLSALVLSQHPAYSPEDVRQVIRASATSTGLPGWDPQFGYGIINAPAALALPSVLQARITTAAGQQVNTPVAVSGVAQGPNFDHYVLEYGAGEAPLNFTTIQTGTTPVNGGVLGTFDPRLTPDGLYTIRLTSFDSFNHAFSDRLELIVDFVNFTTPASPLVPSTAAVYKPGAHIPLAGTATGGTFQAFHAQWAPGMNPTTGWNSAGITLAGGGTAPVTAGLLGDWDTTGINSAGFYSIRIVVDNAGFSSQAQTLVYLEPDLISQNWPKALDAVPFFSAGFIPVSDAAGNQRLVLSPRGSYLSFAVDGSSQNVISVGSSDFNPAAGEMDAAGGQEVVIPDALGLRVFRADNTSFLLPLPAAQNAYFFVRNQVVLADLEGTGQLDAVNLAQAFDSSFFPLPTALLFAWRRDGSLLSNFPISIPDQSDFAAFPSGVRFLTGDVNGDGRIELVVVEGAPSNTFTLGLFAHDGSPLSWPVPSFTGRPGPMVLADLDHNGKLETIIAELDTASNFAQAFLHVLQPDGTERPGWPVTINTPGRGTGSIAVGDLDRDGTDEIVVSTQGLIFVLEPNGQTFSSAWPHSPICLTKGCPVTNGEVVLADIDGDGFPEILVPQFNLVPSPVLPSAAAAVSTQPAVVTTELTAQGAFVHSSIPGAIQPAAVNPARSYATLALTALRRDGTIAKTWNLQGANGNQPDADATITVGDFNHDGITDIAVSYFTIPGGGPQGGPLVAGVATVLSTGAPFHPEANDWPMVYQNPRNSAVRARPDFTVKASPASATIRAGASASFTFTVTPINGFSGPVTFSCSGLPALSKCSFAPASVPPNGSPVNSTLIITTTAPVASLVTPGMRRTNLPLFASLCGGLLGILWMSAGRSRSRRGQGTAKTVLAILALSLTAALASCGSGSSAPQHNAQPGTPAGTSQITVTTSASPGSHVASVTLTVTN
jgi:hypothetical protein